MRADNLAGVGDDELAVVVEKTVESLENVSGGKIELVEDNPIALAKGTQMPVESTSAPSESASVSASRENMVANSRLSGLPCATVLWAKVRTMKRKMEIQKSMKKPCAAS